MSVLIILSGKHQGKRMTLPEGDVTIGRDETCQVRLATHDVSRFHCRVRTQGDKVLVTDLGSRNGTLINDVAIQSESPLQPGDTLRVGPVAFQLAPQKGAAEARPAQPKSNHAATDDSIQDWLAVDVEKDSANDTTVVKREPVSHPTPLPPSKTAANEAETPMPGAKKFRSIGEEGEDLIQRHFELVQSGKLPKKIPALKPKK